MPHSYITNIMIVRERLKEYIKSLGLTNQQFETRAGLSNGYIANMRDSVGKSGLERISKSFPDLNPGWLLTGDGEMLKYKSEAVVVAVNDEPLYVPLLPIEAQGGSLNDFVVSVKDRDCERVVSPIRGADFAITVAGDSMAPEYPAGSQILIKRINAEAFIEWGKVYVIDTCNGSVVKKLMPSNRDECVKCLSINPAPEYAPFEVCKDDIYGIYRVLMCMSVK